jgi:hypothetical protein
MIEILIEQRNLLAEILVEMSAPIDKELDEKRITLKEYRERSKTLLPIRKRIDEIDAVIDLVVPDSF